MRSLWFWKAFVDQHWHEDLVESFTNDQATILSICNIILSLVASGCAASLRDTMEDCDTIIRQESCNILLFLQTKLNTSLLEESKVALSEQLRYHSMNQNLSELICFTSLTITIYFLL